MASNQTPNLALPLWEASDAILREDFNRMTQTIDAAVTAARSRIGLAEYTLSSQTATHSIDVSGIDFTRYRTVTVYLTNLRGSGYLHLYLNNDRRNIYNVAGSRRPYLSRISLSASEEILPNCVTLIFYGGMAYTCVKAQYFSGSTGRNGDSVFVEENLGVETATATPATLQSIDLSAMINDDPGTLLSGAKITIVGEPL